MSYFECFIVTVPRIYSFNPKFRLFFVRNWLLLYINENAKWCVHSRVDTHTIDSLFFVFPSDIWCKINELLKY